MIKKIFAIVLCLAFVGICGNKMINANTTHLTAGAYTGEGMSEITATSACANTTVSTYTLITEFTGTYVYIRNFSGNASIVNLPISNGGNGGCYRNYPIDNTDRSNYVTVTHRIKSSDGATILATGYTGESYITLSF